MSTRILGISGSLRTHSFNTRLLEAMAALAPAECEVETAGLEGIPLYNADVEKAQGLPPAAKALKEKVAGADGLLIVSPEYNNSIPGVVKNAIDWLSRPPADSRRVFGGKPVGVVGASPGPGGTRLSQLAWLPVLRTLGTEPWFGRTLALAQAGQAFDDDGRLVDETARKSVEEYMKGFLQFVRSHAAARD